MNLFEQTSYATHNNSVEELPTNQLDQLLQQFYINEVMCGNDKLYEVLQHQMQQRLHKFVVAVIWRTNQSNIYTIGRGTGVLISPNLVLTCAHNFYNKMKRMDNTCIQIYPQLCGELRNPKRIQQVYIPQVYQSCPGFPCTLFDYALIKLTEKVNIEGFMGLRVNSDIQQQVLAIFGYPDQKYKNTSKITNIQRTSQWGLIKQNSVVKLRQKNREVIHNISTLPGQSGSPIVCIEQFQSEKMSIIGLHKGGILLTTNEDKAKTNIGNLITPEMIVDLHDQSLRMKAQKFIIEDRQSIARYLIEKGRRLSLAGLQLKTLDLYMDADKIYPDCCSYKQILRLVQQLEDKSDKIHYYEDIIKEDSKQFNAYVIVAMIYKSEMADMQATYFLEEAIKNNPEYEIGWSCLAWHLQSQQTIDESIDYYIQVLKVNPQSSQAHFQLANIYYDQGKFQEAIVEYRIAVQINPKFATAYCNFGLALMEVNKMKEATACFRTAISLKPNYLSCHLGLGMAFYSMNLMQQAIEFYHKATVISPQDATCYLGLGMSLYASNKISEAIRVLRIAQQLNPRDDLIYYYLGSALADLTRYKQSIECYHTALDINPALTTIYNKLGAIYEKLKQEQLAKLSYLKAKEIGFLNSKIRQSTVNLMQKRIHLEGNLSRFYDYQP